MLLTRPKAPTPPRRGGGGPLASRRGTLLVAALLSLLAGAALLVFLRQYREDVTSSDRARVVVAASLLPEGTPGDVVLERRMYRVARVRTDDLRGGALTDPSDLKGKVVNGDVAPGHQLTLDDLSDGDGEVRTHLAGYTRAMTVPLDGAHGMIGTLTPGDRVDVITTADSSVGGVTVSSVATRGALVLKVPDGDGSGVVGRQDKVTIRVPDSAASVIASAADGGKVWLVLRPAVGARSHGTDATALGAANGKQFKADVNITAKVGGN